MLLRFLPQFIHSHSRLLCNELAMTSRDTRALPYWRDCIRINNDAGPQDRLKVFLISAALRGSAVCGKSLSKCSASLAFNNCSMRQGVITTVAFACTLSLKNRSLLTDLGSSVGEHFTYATFELVVDRFGHPHPINSADAANRQNLAT